MLNTKETRMAHHADARNSTFVTVTGVKAAGKSPLEGRWDMTIDWNGKPAPGWLEVRHSGTNMLRARW